MEISQEHLEICPVDTSLELLSGKWKPRILWHLHLNQIMRYGELRRALPGITAKVLTQQLRDLEEDGLIARKAYDQAPPKVEYSLTPFGQTFAPILTHLANWGLENQALILDAIRKKRPDVEVILSESCFDSANLADETKTDDELNCDGREDFYEDFEYVYTESVDLPTIKATTVRL